MNFVEIHLNDYAAATFHLSPLEDGIYWRLLRCYYRDEKPLPADVEQCARMAGCRLPEEFKAARAVLEEFFTIGEDGWRQARCDAELERFKDKSKAASTNAKKRWEKERNATAVRPHSEGNASHLPTLPPTHPPSKNPRSPQGGMPEGFAEFWLAWPPNERKQDKAKCLAHWKAKSLEALAGQIVADVRVKRGTRKWAEGFQEAPLTYLRGQRWEDGVTPQTQGPAAPAGKQSALEAANAAVASRVLAEMGEGQDHE